MNKYQFFAIMYMLITILCVVADVPNWIILINAVSALYCLIRVWASSVSESLKG